MKLQNVVIAAAIAGCSAAVLHVGRQAPVVPAPPAAVVQGPTPAFNKDTMPPVSNTLKCIINLALQYFVVYTALAILRTVNQMKGGYQGAQKLFESAASTVVYAPMLSVLFMGTRMRAIQLTQGDTEKYGLPQSFVQQGMQYATWSVLAQVLIVLVIPLFTGETEVPTDAEGNVDLEKLQKKMNAPVMYGLTALKYLTLISLYAGTIAVVYGTYTMPAPDAIWGPGGAPSVSPAVDATVNLSAQFFVIYLGLAFVRTAIQFQGKGPTLNLLEGAFTLATFTVNMAPMLCLLFIGARMRALQIDPKNGAPQAWAQNCFYLCAYSVMAQALLILLLPFLPKSLSADGKGIRCQRGDFEGDVKFAGLSGAGGACLTALRYAATLALYGGFTGIIYSIFTIAAKDKSATPSLSPAMACVMGLTLQYFLVYLTIFVANTVKTFSEGKYGGRVAEVAEAARATVMFAPMLSIVFLAARQRALQLAKAADGSIPAGAGPYVWMQHCMQFATWAVLIQLLLVACLSYAYPVQMDLDGNVVTPKDVNVYLGYTLNTLRYGSMVAMYGGATGVLYGAATMTPETLPPYANQQPLLPEPIPEPVAPPLPATPGQF